jgi:tRNA threonylcarbamoyl adenosine modification protein (Sua5/YciO/YrdC/YwlC family)
MRVIAKDKILEAAHLVSHGGTLVFPTETSYGLGCDATDELAVKQVLAIKNRPEEKTPLIVVGSVEEAKRYLVWNNALKDLANKHWPGALTIVGKYTGNGLAAGVVRKDNTIAVRVTTDPWLRELCAQIGRPIVATSANISGSESQYDFGELANTFFGRELVPDAMVDGGTLEKSLPTTIVSVVDGGKKILRFGAVAVDASPGASTLIGVLVIVAAAAISAISILYFWNISLIDIENNTRFFSGYHEPHYAFGVKNPLIKVKGLYLTAYSAGSAKKMDEIIALIKATELNAVVIDIKDYSGLVLYDSDIATVNNLKTEDNRLGDVAALVKKLHDNHIYVIARQTIFQDPVLAEAKPEWSIKRKSGGVWRDKKGLAWVDPTRREVWEYNVAVAKEAIKFGFDEINFDYVRFPSDGNMSEVVYTVGDRKKFEVMADFYRFMNTRLANEPVWLSLDLFGFVMEKDGEDDMNIGQRLSDTVDNADYVCPMMYPSHYPSGHLGLSNPADYPVLVFENGFQKGAPKAVGHRAKIRPWIQAFNLGAIYDAEKIRAQIAVAEKYSDAGWLLWNASNRYTNAGLN